MTKIAYNMDESRLMDGLVELDPDTELALMRAQTDDERRAVVEPVIIADALTKSPDAWLLRRIIEFGVDDEETDDDESWRPR